MLIYFKTKLKEYFFKRKWRIANNHNQTMPGTCFPFELVKVGSYTYGTINLIFHDPDNTIYKLIIGNFVSIANNVNFLLSENHQTKTITTFPLKSFFRNELFPGDAISKGSIIIEDEVWIGYGVTILSGVTIGKGAVIASGAVVTSNIPPYTLAGGVPAKVIRHRFSEEITASLLNLKLIDLPQDILIKNIELFYKKIYTKDELNHIELLFKRINEERND